MVDGLHGLWHDAVIGGNHEDGQVGGLSTTGTHGGKGLVARGIQESDGALAVHVHRGLVGTNALGDAAFLAGALVGLTDGVQQPGLTVVNVTHNGDDWRTILQCFLAAFVLAELQVEGLEQLAVLVFRGDDLDVVIDLGAKQLQRIFRYGSGCRHHFTEVEQCLHQCCRIRADLLGEVRQGCATTQADGLALAIWQAHAAYDMLLLLLVLMALLTLGLLALTWSATWTAECTRGAAATSAASTAAETAWTAATWATVTRSAVTAATAAATSTTARCLRRHRRRVRVGRHHGRGWTATAATLVIATLAVISALVLATALTAVIAWLIAATLTLGATWARARTVVAATRGERVISYATGTAWLRHWTRHGIAWGRALARLLAASLAWLRCALARLRCSSHSTRLRRLSTRLRGSWLCAGLSSSTLSRLRCALARLRCSGLRAWLWRLCARLGGSRLRTWLRGALLCGALSGTLGRLIVLLLFGGVIAAGLCFIMSSHLLNHRRFDGGRSSLYKLTLFFQGGEQFLAGYSELLCELVNT